MNTNLEAAADSFHLKKILVPVDFSLHSLKSLRYALPFARRFGAELLLVHAVEPQMYPADMGFIPPEMEEINLSLIKESGKRLVELSGREIDPATPCKTIVRPGAPFDVVCEIAREEKADLIIVATHGFTGLKHILLGSTAERIVRHAPCPVLTVRAHEREFV